MFCAKHPKEATSLTCGRCGIPICSRCTVHTDVGIRCQGCSPPTKNVRQRRHIPIARTIGFLLTIAILATWIPFFYHFIPLPFGSSGNDYENLVDEGPPQFEGVVTVNQMADPWEQADSQNQPTAGRRFVALELTVANPEDSDEPIYWNQFGLKLTDSENFAYAPASFGEQSQLQALELKPGEKTSGWVVFEVDENHTVGSLTYWASEVALPPQ
jgi:hypothetical protein